MQWFRHVFRLINSSQVKIAYVEDFMGKHPKGRPPNRWYKQLKVDTGLPILTVNRTETREKKVVMRNVSRISGV